MPSSLSELLLATLVALGGQAYLVRQAEENPRAFLALIAKLLAAELRPSREPRRGRGESAQGAAQPRAAESETVQSGTIQSGTSQSGAIQSGVAKLSEDNPRGFLSLISKMLTAELKPSRAPRRDPAGSTETDRSGKVQLAAVTSPADPPDSIFVMLDDEPLVSGQPDQQSLTHPAARRTANQQPSPRTAFAQGRTLCAPVTNLSHKHLWKHAAKWQPSFSERWNGSIRERWQGATGGTCRPPSAPDSLTAVATRYHRSA